MTWGLDPGLLVIPAAHPARVLKDALKGRMSAKYPDLAYGLGLPEDWASYDGPPLLVVFDDGGASEWPVSDRATLRVTAWSNSLTKSREIAAFALGVTLTHRVEGLSQILPGTRVIDARDPENGAEMASYTVRARARTTIVSE